MTQNSMFFSDGSWYTQEMFARFLKDIFGHDGVVDNIGNELAVSANSPANMAVSVATGRSYVQGYFHEILTDAVQLAISDADPTNPRIDRIVLRLDVNTSRNITVAVLAGTPAASPVAPTLTQTSTIWEVSLAQVRVDANATVINSGNITDERQYMWMNRDNMPKASTTEYGSMKVGAGLTVNNGVVSVGHDAYLEVPNVSITNSGGFAVSQETYTQNTYSYGGQGTGSSWANYGTPYTPITPSTTTHIDFPPFVDVSTTHEYTVNMTVTGYNTNGMYRYQVLIRGVKVSDGTVLGSGSLSVGQGSSEWGGVYGSVTLTLTLPDWSDSDQIQLQVMDNGSHTSGGSLTGISASGSTITTRYYYKPQAPTS